MVEDGTGGVLLVGGQKQDNHFLDSIYSLQNADSFDSDWTLMNNKLKTARSFHAAIMVTISKNKTFMFK
jgi:hypothetical protein